MSSLFEVLARQLGGDAAETISQQLGADQQQTKTAIAAAIPSLVEALSRQAAQPGGADSLHNAIQRDHDGSLLDQLSSYIGAAPQSRAPSKATAGGQILDHVLGAKRTRVESGISQMSGLDASSVSRLMAMLAPLVMGALGKNQRSQQLNPAQLNDYLQQQRRTFQEGNPAQAGILGKMLDQDGDGDFDASDMMRLGSSFISRMFK